MLEFELLDEVDDPDDHQIGRDYEWSGGAFQALTDFLGTVGRRAFSSSEFHRWAAYYCCLEKPQRNGAWGALFNRARRYGIIAPVGTTHRTNKLWAIA